MARLVFYLVGLLGSSLVMFHADVESRLFTISSALAVGFVIPLIDALILQHHFFKIIWYSLRTYRSRVRISAAYLYRIHVDNEYLLVKGNRFDQYQPVGGVYKFRPSSLGSRSNMNILNDNLLMPDETSEDDLRVRVQGKKLLPFFRWFESGRGREVDGWREFYEELVATQIVSHKNFQFINYEWVDRRYQPMRYSQWAKSQEILIFDVLELHPTVEQINELKELKKNTDSRILWATEEQIRGLGTVPGESNQLTRISQTAEWTIDATV